MDHLPILSEIAVVITALATLLTAAATLIRELAAAWRRSPSKTPEGGEGDRPSRQRDLPDGSARRSDAPD